ncbi:hypothetical protein V8E53_010031 [Lactarius tabidus]
MYSHAQQAPQPPQLLVDGYISIMLGPRDADAYHSTLLRRGAGPLRAYTVQGYPLPFYAVPSPVPSLEPPTPWVVDYAALDMGTVIPQRLWVPPPQHEFLCPPIFFFQRGRLGFPLNQAAGGNLMYLDGASRPAPLGANCGNHAQIRLNWRGYTPWDAQIMIRTQARAGPEIAPLERFVKHVARKVHQFMTNVAMAQAYNSDDPRWFIGPGGITPDDVVLIGAVHVSRGSWMPILQLSRFVL